MARVFPSKIQPKTVTFIKLYIITTQLFHVKIMNECTTIYDNHRPPSAKRCETSETVI